MDYKRHFEQSWQTFTRFLPHMLGLTVVVAVCSFFSFGILAPVLSAGYTYSLLLAMREGRQPELKDAFSQMQLFLPLLGFGVLVAIALSIGFVLLFLPGMLMTLALIFFCLYMLVLMVDKEMGLMDALRESSKMAMQPPVLEHIAVIAVIVILNGIGSSVLVGCLLTTPFSTLLLLSVYEAKVTRELPQPETTNFGPSGNEPPPPPPGA